MMASMKWWAVRLAAVLAIALLLVFSQSEQHPAAGGIDSVVSPPPFDANEVFANVCLTPELGESGEPAPQANGNTMLGGDLPSVRSVLDPYPAFNGVVLDPENNLAMLSDANKKSLLIYDRASGSHSAEVTPPLRQIIGPDTLAGYLVGMIADGDHREIFAVNNDIEDSMVVYSYDHAGNMKPKRVLGVPHGAWGLSLSKARNEIAVSVGDVSANAVVFYRREARQLEAPLRTIQGRKTELADPHGIYVDDANKELVIANWGSWNVPLGAYSAPRDATQREDLPGGKFNEPSITVHPATAEGDVAPLRKIQGPATQLNWPTGLDVDNIGNEIVIANNGDNSVLIFPRTGRGNLKPSRIIRGPRTGINRPMSVAIDRKNNELWVANFGDHTAVIFDLKAKGNAAPKRIVRNAPAGSPSSGFGNPMSVTYDSKRDELLVPN
jgi:DNA-binding beta-propeller fold protein YncE